MNFIRSILSRKIVWVYILTLLFIAVNAILIANEWYYSLIFPFAILLVGFAVFSLDKLLLAVVFMVPLSIPLLELVPQIENDMYLPTEPLLAGMLIIFIAKLIYERNFDRKVLLHPISILIYVNLFWILITSITSTMPIVSFKFLLARMWFLASFYFFASQLFKNEKNMMRFSWAYVIPLIIVIGYTINRHLAYGLYNKEVANFVSNPFYSDHTSYGAVIAIYLPVIFGFLFLRKYSFSVKIIIGAVIAVLLVAITLSYTRAAWISLVGGLGLLLVMKFGFRFRSVMVILIIGVLLYFQFETNILNYLERNRQDSSVNLTEHIQSISNVSSDASNLERLNRWYCAFRMFDDKPVFGFGPGTYMFKYAPYQFSYQKTVISTNSGDVGNAHSEYIGPLAEQGIVGALSIISIVLCSLYYGMKVVREAKNREIKIIATSVVIGLSTYFMHGALNNFLDTDKISAPFWGFIAMIVAIDVYFNKENEVKQIIPEGESVKELNSDD